MRCGIRLRGRRRWGLTLVESMVVVGVLAVLMALVLPAIRRAREAARYAQCQGNLKGLSLAMHNYHSVWGAFPPGYYSLLGPVKGGANPPNVEMGPGWAWGTLILPFIEQTPLYNAANLELPMSAWESHTVRATPLTLFLCPSVDRVGPVDFHMARPVPGLPADMADTQYVACGGTSSDLSVADGMFGRDRCVRMTDVIDGTSTTIMLGERSRMLSDAAWAGVVPDGRVPGARHGTDPSWASPSTGGLFATVLGYTDRPAGDPNPMVGLGSARAGHEGFRGLHPGRCNFAFTDGSVKFINDSVLPRLYHGAGTIAGGSDSPFADGAY